MRSPARLFVLVAVSLSTSGCAGIGQYLEFSRKGCAAGQGDDCWQLGEMWLQKASWTFFAGWPHPVDTNQAREAFRRGCKVNSLRSCAALLERHLVDDQAAERAALVAYLELVGVPQRSDQEVSAMDTALSEAARADVAQKAKSDRERLANALRQIAGAVQQATQEIASKLSAPSALRPLAPAKTRPRKAIQDNRGQPLRATVAPAFQCTGFGRPCAGKNICCTYNSVTPDCRNNRCCISIGWSCNSQSDCCDAPRAICSEPTNGGVTPSRCCYPSGTSVSGPGECCSAKLDPRTSVGSSRVDLQACKLEYSIVSPK